MFSREAKAKGRDLQQGRLGVIGWVGRWFGIENQDHLDASNDVAFTLNCWTSHAGIHLDSHH